MRVLTPHHRPSVHTGRGAVPVPGRYDHVQRRTLPTSPGATGGLVRACPVLAPESSQSDERVPPEGRCLLCPPPRPERPWRLADPGYRSCSSCLDRLRESLREIGARWSALDPRPGASGDGGRGAPGFGSTPPANVTVIAVRDWRSSREARTWRGADGRLHREHERPPLSVVAELWTLAKHVADARGLTPPDRVHAPDLVRWLDGQLDWVTRQDGVVGFARVVRELAAQLRPLTGERRAAYVGKCPNPVEDDDEVRACAARLYAPQGDEIREIRCRACGRHWSASEFLHLGRTMQVAS